jgi:phage gpG-like protein
MAGYHLDLKVLGADEIAHDLRAMGDRAIMAAPAMEEIVDVFRESERALWTRGRSWAPNAPATVAHKGRNSPLVRSGRLKASLTEEYNRDQIVEVTPDSAKFGTKLWYAHFALGTDNQPKREVIKLRASDRIQIREIIREWVLYGAMTGLRIGS